MTTDTRYISKFISYRNDDGPWFPIHLLPSPSSWVVVDENPHVMHRMYKNRPLLLWIIGSFVGFRLESNRADTPPCLEVIIDFLRELDRDSTIRAHNGAATKPLTEMKTLTTKSPTCEDEGYLVSVHHRSSGRY